MNFLEICKKVRQKVGVGGTGPTTVVAQTGALLRIVDCVNEAWREIQASQTEWKFMQKTGTLALVGGTQSYSLATIVAANATYGRLVKGTIKYPDGARARLVDYDQWEYDNTDIGTETGRPVKLTEDADRALLFYPIPDAAYTLRFRFNRAAQVLAADADIPICPEDFHMAIVYRAVLCYANNDEASELFKTYHPEYLTWMTKLESDQLPTLGWGESVYRSPL